MDRAASWCRALCAAIVAFDLAFVAPSISALRVLWYEPIARRWEWTVHPAVLGMDWYGKTLMSAIAGTIVFAILIRFQARRSAIPLWAGWAAIATGLCIAMQVFQLVTRHPVPEPLPSWYVPR